MKIAIAGSGALGSGFGAKLFQHGYDVTLIDNWEPQVTTIQQDGLHIDINGEAHHFRLPMYRLTEIPKATSYDIVFYFQIYAIRRCLVIFNPIFMIIQLLCAL